MTHSADRLAVVMTAQAIVVVAALGLTGEQAHAGQWSTVVQQREAGQQDERAQPTERTLGEMSTDRPDITDSTDMVGRGVWQLETGVSFESDHLGAETQHELAAPLAMLRIGLSQRVELRVSGDGVLSDTVTVPGARRATGASDIEVGAKWKLFAQPHGGFLFALEPVLSLPSGSDDFTSAGYDPTLKLIADRDLARGFSLSSNLVVSSLTVGENRFTQHAISVSVAHALHSGWHAFVELYRASALVRDGHDAWIADTGATYALGDRMQLDVSVGRGLSDAAPDWFMGAGFSVRGFLRR